MTEPSLKAAQRKLSQALKDADDWYTEATYALPDSHTWRDVDLLSIEASTRSVNAYRVYDQERAEFEAFVAADSE